MKNVRQNALLAVAITLLLSTATMPAIAQDKSVTPTPLPTTLLGVLDPRAQLFIDIKKALPRIGELGRQHVKITSNLKWKQMVDNRANNEAAAKTYERQSDTPQSTIEHLLALLKTENARAEAFIQNRPAIEADLDQAEKSISQYESIAESDIRNMKQFSDIDANCSMLKKTLFEQRPYADNPTATQIMARNAKDCLTQAEGLFGISKVSRDFAKNRPVVRELMNSSPLARANVKLATFETQVEAAAKEFEPLTQTASNARALININSRVEKINADALVIAKQLKLP